MKIRMFKKSTYTVLLVMLAILTACHFVEVNMVQRAVLDDGDGTTDTVRSTIQKPESENYEVLVPFK